MKHLHPAFVAVALCLLGGVVTAQERPDLLVPAAAPPPEIDGRLDEPCWNGTQSLGFTGLRDTPLKNATTARLVYDAANLYVGIRCEEGDMANLRTAWSHAEERDNAIWQDDCVEIFLDPLSRGTATGAHIAVNSAGVWYDAWDGDRAWDCDVRNAVVKEPGAWTVEIAIPFDDLGFRPRGGET